MMMKRLRFLTAFAAATVLTLSCANAWASQLAGLEVSFGSGIDTSIRGDLRASLDKNAKATFSYTPAETARAKLNPVIRDCFTSDCLKKAGDALKADAGLRLRFSGEAQIYDWSIEVYSLKTGEVLADRKGACELCGRSEVNRTFERSLQGVFGDAKKRLAPAPKPKPTAKPEPKAAEGAQTEATKPERRPAAGAHVVEVNLDVQPSDALVTYREEAVGTGRVTLQLSPGEHELLITAEGHRAVREQILVTNESSETMSVRVHLAKKDAPPEAVKVAAEGPVDRWGSKNRMIFGITGVATGLAGLGIGAWLSAIDGEPTCDGPARECPDIYRTGGAAFVTTFAGATLLTAGAVLLAWEALAGKTDSNTRVAPTVDENSAGISIFGRF